MNTGGNKMDIIAITKYDLNQTVYVIEKANENNEKNFKEWATTDVPCKILSITAKCSNGGISLMYRVHGHGKAKEQNLFLDKEDAVKECQRRNAILEERQSKADHA